MVRVLPPFKRASLVLRFTGPAIGSLDNKLLPTLRLLISRSSSKSKEACSEHSHKWLLITVARACVLLLPFAGALWAINWLHAACTMKGVARSLYMPG